MAEVNILVCDHPKHAANEDHWVDMQGTQMPPMVVNGALKAVVLCEDHEASMSLGEFIELVTEYGKQLAIEERPKKRGPKPKTAAATTSASEPQTTAVGQKTWSCHYCEDERDTPQGRTRHEMSAHPEEWKRDREAKKLATAS